MQYHIEEWTPEKVLEIAKAWAVLEDDLRHFVVACIERLQEEMGELHGVIYDMVSLKLDTDGWGFPPQFKVEWVRRTFDPTQSLLPLEHRTIVKTEPFHFSFSATEFSLGFDSYFPKFFRKFKVDNALEEKRARETALYNYKQLKERWGFE